MRKQALLILAFLLIVSFLVAGCGQTAASKNPPPPASTSAVAGSQVKPVLGGTFKWAWKSGPTAFGLPLSATGPSADTLSFTIQPLIRHTEKPGIYEPVLAESWSFSSDKLSLTFNLRKGVKFHDGTPFNADAVKWNHERLLASANPRLKMVKSIDVIDDYTIRYNLTYWNTLVLWDFTYGDAAGIISPTAFKEKGEDWCKINPVGTGPWKFQEYQRDTYIKFIKNPDYWDKTIPYLDFMELDKIADPLVLYASLIKGDVDGWREVDVDSAAQLTATGQYNIESISGGHMILWYNNTDPASPWSDVKMRQALEYAIDKETIAKSLGKGFCDATYEYVNDLEAVGGKSGTAPRKVDYVKAKELLKAAGYPEGISVNLSVNQKFNTPFVQALQGSLAKAGIKVEIQVKTDAEWAALQLQPCIGSELRYDRQTGGGAGIVSTVNNDFTTKSIKFPAVVRPPGWQEALDSLLIEENSANIVTILTKMEKMAYDAAMFTPLWTNNDLMAYSKNLKWDTSKRASIWTAAWRPTARLDLAWLQK